MQYGLKKVKSLENKIVNKHRVINNKNLRIKPLENLLLQRRNKQFWATSEKTAADQKQLFEEADTDSNLEDLAEQTSTSIQKRKKTNAHLFW